MVLLIFLLMLKMKKCLDDKELIDSGVTIDSFSELIDDAQDKRL